MVKRVVPSKVRLLLSAFIDVVRLCVEVFMGQSFSFFLPIIKMLPTIMRLERGHIVGTDWLFRNSHLYLCLVRFLPNIRQFQLAGAFLTLCRLVELGLSQVRKSCLLIEVALSGACLLYVATIVGLIVVRGISRLSVAVRHFRSLVLSRGAVFGV
jgi:hypothetical protein